MSGEVTFTIAGVSITITGLAFATVGIVLNAVFYGKDYKIDDAE